MPRYIIKLTDNDKDYYLLWSTIVDAPVTHGMSLEDFKIAYEQEYGRSGMSDLSQRLERVEQTGSSEYMGNLESLLGHNRAGENESCLTKEEIIKKYCLTTPSGE
jgi:hypothetical protein